VLTIVIPPPAFLHLLPPEYNLVRGTFFMEVQLLLICNFLTLALPIPYMDDEIPPRPQEAPDVWCLGNRPKSPSNSQIRTEDIT